MSAQQRIERESHKDPDTLEREIEAKRREISGIVDELEHKLSPGDLFDRALGFVRGNGGEFMHNLNATIKANPVPTLLTSVGLLWLMNSSREPYPHDRARYASADIYGTDSDSASRLHDAASSIRDRASSLRDDVSERMHDASHRVSEAGHRIGETTHRAADSMRRGAQHAREGFNDMLVEQPLAVGAIGIAVGALLAALLPPTRQEDQWLGDASERVRQRAGELAGSGLERASETLADSQRRSGTGATGSDSQYRTPGQTH